MSDSATPTARKYNQVLKAANEKRTAWEMVCADPNHTKADRRGAWEAFMFEVSAVHTAPTK